MKRFDFLDGAGAMQSALGLQVGSMGFFGGSEVTNKNDFAAAINGCAKWFFYSVMWLFWELFIYAKKTCRAIASGFALILTVLARWNIAQVCNAVVAALTVYMVNVVFRKLAINVQPSKPVCFVLPVINKDMDVSGLVQVSGNTASQRHATPNTPSENTRFGVVVQKFFKTLLRQSRITVSHFVAPVKQWIGQMPDSVRSGFGHRNFNMGGC